MNNKILVIIFGLTFFLASSVCAKRQLPKDVNPIVYEGIKYTAPTDKMGYVVASDVKTGKVLWEKKVYEVTYQMGLEQDVQDVFISGLEIRDNV